MTSSLAHTTQATGDTARPFSDRHIGPRTDDVTAMLAELGYDSLSALSSSAVPDSIQNEELDLPEGRSEFDVLNDLRDLADQNVMRTQLIGQGYYDTITPAVIRRNLVENPAWYTAYTPYQPEISQGRLEALLNFQQVVQDLTGLDIANASLLDEATAVAEAVLLMRRAVKKGTTVVLDSELHPQTIAVVRARAKAMDFRITVADLSEGLVGEDIFGIVCAQPGTTGAIRDFSEAVTGAHDRGALVTFAADLLALTLLKEPGSQGADIAVGLGPALRCPPVLRRTPRRLHGREVRSPTSAARPARRSLQGRSGQARLPSGPADP